MKAHSIIRILYHLIQNDTACQFEEKANCLLGVLGFPPPTPLKKGKKEKEKLKKQLRENP